VLVVAKANVATAAQVEVTVQAARTPNPRASGVKMALNEGIDHPELVRGRKVLVVEDGPSVTHGGLREPGGARAASLFGALRVEPRPCHDRRDALVRVIPP
jgi:predicted GTPase